jgi:hypothetical protein
MRTQPLDVRALRASRQIHTWSGIFLALLICIEGCTGFVLLHADGLESVLKTRVSYAWAPWRADEPQKAKDEHVLAVVELPESQGRIVARGPSLYRVSASGAARPVLEQAAFGKIHALALHSSSLWVGHEDGLARCALRDQRCQAVDTGALASPADIRGIATLDDFLLVADHHQGLFAVAESRDELRLEPWPVDENSSAEASAMLGHIHALAVSGDRFVVGTQQGVVRIDPKAKRASFDGLRKLDVESLAASADGALWASSKGKDPEARTLWHRPRGMLQWDRVSVPAPAREDKGETPWVIGASAFGDASVLAGSQQLTLGSASGWTSLGLGAVARIDGIEVKKIVDDLHTGHAFGVGVRLLYDLTAIGMLLFAVTGVHLWWTPRRMKRAKERSSSRAAPRSPKVSANA